MPPAHAGDARDLGSIPGSGRSPGEGNCNPFLYSCLENSMDRRAWWATVHGVRKSQTRLSTHIHTHTHTHMVIQEKNDFCILAYIRMVATEMQLGAVFF